MTIRNLLIALVVVLLAVNACQKEPTVTSGDTSSPLPVHSRSGNFQNAIDAFYLATIDILKNLSLVNIIRNQAAGSESDDKVTFQYLQSQASQIGINLVDLMKNSVIANGGTAQQAVLVEQSISGFTDNSQTLFPFIYFPF
ncbi:MAG: hypothetical protein OHK0019_08710 [Saprospiraceae bacterium]